MRQKSVLVIPADQWACGRERVYKPYNKLAKQDNGKIKFTVHNEPEVRFQYLLTFDAVVFQRPIKQQVATVIKELKKFGIKTVVEIDDRLDCVHRDNVASSVFHNNSEANNNFFECLKHADAVHTSTPEIATAYRLKNDARNIHVFLNAIDFGEDIYTKYDPLRGMFPEGQINVLWAGSTSHWDSIKFIRGVIEHPISQRDNAHLVICGNKEFYDVFDLPPEKKTYIEGTPDVSEFPYYPSIGHISLAPVVPSPFNDGKSELKCLEAAIWKSPVIASPVAPYTRFKDNGGGVLIAKNNRPIEWQKQLSKLLDNPEMIKELGEQSYKTAFEKYNLDTENVKRLDFWMNFLGVK
jgi:glycosyltransferase involved in cell wall biosynthesis